MRALTFLAIVVALIGSFALGWMVADPSAHGQAKEVTPAIKGWTKGKGFAPVSKDDEVGALNAMSRASVRAALGLVREGKVYDLGVNYDAESFKWPGHNPGVIMTYRGPEGIKRQGDFQPVADPNLNPDGVAWHSCALFISDNVGTQIDGLAHITAGDDNAWYNGFKEAQWGGNFGVRKCDSTSIPPIITRGVLLDVARFRKVDALPAHYRITAADLRATAEAQKVKLRPGDTVLIRTGTMRHWGVNGSDHKTLAEHDSAGIDLSAAKWLVEEQGAIVIGADTSGLEWSPGPMESAGGFIPVHRYLLVEQGVHIGEFHNLENLARERVYEFCYVCTTNKIRGTVAGFALRPIAIR